MNANTSPKKRKGQYKEVWRRFKKNRSAMIGLVIVSILILLAVCADLIVDISGTTTINGSEFLQSPSWEHWFGTDHLGRDLFARMLHGSRISLSMGLIVVVIVMSIGAVLGSAAGYYGGWFDGILMRLLDVLYCIPSMLLTMVIVTTLGKGIVNLLIALSIGSIPGICRLVRSMVMNLSDSEYIEAARAFGCSGLRIVLKHIMPNAMGVIIVQATSMVAGSLIAASSMSFLGFGVQPPTAEWGAILSDARNYLLEAPYLMIIPGLTIVITAMSINLIGDGLRDALDPKLKN